MLITTHKLARGVTALIFIPVTNINETMGVKSDHEERLEDQEWFSQFGPRIQYDFKSAFKSDGFITQSRS